MRSTTSGSTSTVRSSTPRTTRPASASPRSSRATPRRSSRPTSRPCRRASSAAATKEQQDLLLAHPEIFALPQVLLDITQEPYTDGPALVQAILDAGQRARLDAAFQQPPTTSEQVIDPSKFLAGEPAVPVAATDGRRHGVEQGRARRIHVRGDPAGIVPYERHRRGGCRLGRRLVCHVGRRQRQDVSARHVRRRHTRRHATVGGRTESVGA